MPTYSAFNFSKTAVLAVLYLMSLVGCSTERMQMQEPASYSSMNCSQLKAELAAVTHNVSAEQGDSTSAGVVQMMSLITQGYAMGQGNASSAMTLASASDSMQTAQTKSDANAEAYSSRSELLDKLLIARRCK